MTMTTAQPNYLTSYSDNAAENYERYFVPVIPRPFGIDLVAEARLQPGERVLDVACGTGIIARLAAERVGAAGYVAGLDPTPPMLSVARSIPSAIPIRWYETSAESIPLPDKSFDVVFCQLGLQFIADRAAALREMRRVLVPGGRIYINTPVPNPFFDVLDEEIARHVSVEASAFVHAVFCLNDPQELHDLLADAGLTAPAVRVHAKQINPPAARDFMWHYIHCTPLMAVAPRTGSAQGDALERDVVAGWRPWSTPDGMSCEQAVLVGTARA